MEDRASERGGIAIASDLLGGPFNLCSAGRKTFLSRTLASFHKT